MQLLNEIEEEKKELLQQYGKNFETDYGWAASTLNLNRPTFTDIEKSISLDHFRPFYKLANMNIHGGSKSIVYRLGLPHDNSNLLVAGPSLFGLTELGQNAAISINQLTTTLLMTRSNLSRVAFARTTHKLVGEIFDAFIDAENHLIEHNTG